MAIDAIGRTPGIMAAASEARAGAAGETRSATLPFERAPSRPEGAAALSPLAREMAAAPPIDTARVTALREAIVRGDYRPEPMKIAAAMLALEALPVAASVAAPAD